MVKGSPPPQQSACIQIVFGYIHFPTIAQLPHMWQVSHRFTCEILISNIFSCSECSHFLHASIMTTVLRCSESPSHLATVEPAISLFLIFKEKVLLCCPGWPGKPGLKRSPSSSVLSSWDTWVCPFFFFGAWFHFFSIDFSDSCTFPFLAVRRERSSYL